MTEEQNHNTFSSNLGHTKDEWGIKRKKKIINQIIVAYKMSDE
jgi:hypothetical protein